MNSHDILSPVTRTFRVPFLTLLQRTPYRWSSPLWAGAEPIFHFYQVLKMASPVEVRDKEKKRNETKKEGVVEGQSP